MMRATCRSSLRGLSCLAALLVLVGPATAGDRVVATFDGVTLDFLVNKFNLETKEDRERTGEPKLTVEEVVASIYAWRIKHFEDIDDETFAIYRQIAEARQLPKDAALNLITRWGVKDREFDVWWINLEIKTGENRGYGLRVRERLINSREVEPQNRLQLQVEQVDADPK